MIDESMLMYTPLHIVIYLLVFVPLDNLINTLILTHTYTYTLWYPFTPSSLLTKHSVVPNKIAILGLLIATEGEMYLT